jgi:large subunit ribosomal protein L32e
MPKKPFKNPSISQKELKIRARAKNKKPKFVRAESWKYDRFSLSWRKPRGLDNKIRRKIKGWPPGPSVGYKGPNVSRGLHPSGYREVIVNNVDDLSRIDPNTQAARIAHTVGKQKRALIIEKAQKMKIKVLNLPPPPKEEEAEEAEGKEAEAGKEEAQAKEEPKKEKKKSVAKKKPKAKAAKKKESKPKPKKGEETQ